MILPEVETKAPDRQPDSMENWTLIAAVAENGVIGNKNSLPWRLRSDLRRFRQLTMGHCLLMGRRTFESIGKALPGRQTIVLSRNNFGEIPAGVKVASSLQAVAGLVETGRRVMVVGGAEVYRMALPVCDALWITRVQSEVAGDTFFPEVDWNQWQLQSRTFAECSPHDDCPTEFQQWQRKKFHQPSI